MNLNQDNLDRLVDGELTDEQRRALIARFPQEPDGWRQCALAFLEAQSVQAHLTSWVGSADATGAPDRPRCVPDHGGVPVASATGKSRLVGSWLHGWEPWLSLAACLALAFALWRYAFFVPGLSQLEAPSTREVVVGPPSGAEDGQATQVDPMIVSYQPLDMFAGQSALPEDVERQFRWQGYDIRRQKGLLPGRDSQGRQVLLPYEDVQFVPLRQQVR